MPDAAPNAEPSSSPLSGLLRFLVALAPVCALVFLLASGVLSSWEGRVTGKSPATDDTTPATWRVLIVSPDGSTETHLWPASVVDPLSIPLEPGLLPPARVDPEKHPHTAKARFTLHYIVEQPDGTHASVPTTSPQAVGIALIIGLVLLALRNMYVSGSPLDIRPRRTILMAALPRSGQVAAPPSGQSGTHSHPPSKGPRGRKRSHR